MAQQHPDVVAGLVVFSIFLIIVVPASLFASYLVGQSIMLLSASLADGGLATAARIIASKERPDGLLITALQRVLNRYAVLLAGVALIVIAVVVGAFSQAWYFGSVRPAASSASVSQLIAA